MFYITMNHGIITALLFLLSAGINVFSVHYPVAVRVNCETGTNLGSPSCELVEIRLPVSCSIPVEALLLEKEILCDA
jgi:hypothetical protein